MTSQSTLSFKGDTFNVLAFSYSFSRSIDQAGRPGSDINGGRITITVQSKSKNTNVLQSILTKESGLSGKIEVKEADGTGLLKQVDFSEGYIIDYKENFASDGQGMSETFTVTANKVSFEGCEHDSAWATK